MLDFKKIAAFLVVNILSFVNVRAELGDYLVKFGVNGGDRCSTCKIDFARASREVCYGKTRFPNGNYEKIARDPSLCALYRKFGNFCFIDLSDSKFLESESFKGLKSKLFCRQCMIKHLKELRGKVGFQLREFKNRGCFATHNDGTCSVCLGEFARGAMFPQCSNGHAFHFGCLKSSFSYVNELCPTCRTPLNTWDFIPNVKFINQWDID